MFLIEETDFIYVFYTSVYFFKHKHLKRITKIKFLSILQNLLPSVRKLKEKKNQCKQNKMKSKVRRIHKILAHEARFGY